MTKALKTVPATTRNLIQFPEGQPIRLDLGCGDNKMQDFFGIDKFKTDSSDFEFDLFEPNWPIADGTVDAIFSSHFFEHIPALKRPVFMDEVYRVLKVGAQATFIAPYWSSMRAVQDFTHEWPPICEATFQYFNKGWRAVNKLRHGHYDMKCDFDFTYGYALDGGVFVRNPEWQQFALKHYIQAANDIHVTLTKRPPT